MLATEGGNMRIAVILLLAMPLCLACCRPLQQAQPLHEPKEVSHPEGLSILPWPDGEAPGGFMAGLQLVSLPPEQSKMIVENAGPGTVPHVKPHFETPLAAAQYFGTHLSMGGPPTHMTAYTDPDGTRFYLFSGGLHWGKQPLFSETAVLLETGEIRF
jgi:hypothetical protein